MQNVWVISRGVGGRNATFEYYESKDDAKARAAALESKARQEFEELDARVDLGVTWEQYREIQDLQVHSIEVPHRESVNPHDDVVTPTGEVPRGRIWVVLEDGRPEEGRSYLDSEDEAKDEVWSRNWSRWEYYESNPDAAGMTFARYRSEYSPGNYDYAPVDPGPMQT